MVSYIDSYNDFIFNFLVYHYYWILLSSDQLIAVLCVFFSIWILFLKPDFHFDIVPLIVVKETHTACLDSILYKLNTGNGANKHIYLLNFIISLNETIRVEIHTYIHHTKSFPSRFSYPIELGVPHISVRLDILIRVCIYYSSQGTQINYAIGSLVWVEDPDIAWIDGEIIEINGELIKVNCSSGNTVSNEYACLFLHT